MKDNKKSIKMIICVSTWNREVNAQVELDLMNPTEAKRKYKAFKRKHQGLYISDTAMTYNLRINYYDNIDFLLEMSEKYFSEWSEEQIKVFSDLVTDLVTESDWYYVADKVTDYAYALIEIGTCKSDEEAVGRYYADCLDIPKHIEPFFDYESYGRNILEENDNVTNDDYVIIVY